MESAERLKIAFYVTGHGLGHATRVVGVCDNLLKAGHEVIVNTAAPHDFFRQQLPAERLFMRSVLLDCGAVQSDAFTVDMQRTLEDFRRVAAEPRQAKLAAEVAWLRGARIDLVASDVVPLACAAAAQAGIPCACVSNFSWDFVYSEYVASLGARHRGLVWQIAEDYSRADLLLRLPGYCPMPAFREVVDVPLVARKARRSAREVRATLGVPDGSKMLVFMFGGWSPGAWQLRSESLPPGWVCVVCSNGQLPGGEPLPDNFILAAADTYTPDMIGAADCVLGKIGYGSVSECLAHGTPLVFVRRDHFNEEPFLRKLLETHGLALELKRRDFLHGLWRPFLERAVRMTSSFRDPTNGAEVVAEMLEDLAHERKSGGGNLSRENSLALQRRASGQGGATRLRDTIVYGYIMQRHALQEKVDVPEWYGRDSPTSPEARGAAPLLPPGDTPEPAFELLEGEPGVLASAPDTHAFLDTLAGLERRPRPGEPAVELPEQRAARSLFRFEDDIWVARAPGRLDVMGGIADYSGSTVLQMPIAQACHVAAQTHPRGSKTQLWTHIGDRHAAAGTEGAPVLRVVSLNADNTNRGHAFDMDLSELQQSGSPLGYEDARRFFASDPSQSWAAYVAGALLVLMREEGAVFSEGLSLLVSSDVPDGKGVSSSAALEVATMQAVAAACGLGLAPVRLAELCQKVENLVVGAPCGIMDQMAVALGAKDSLLALRCQPAEVLPSVAIPEGLRFWGVDSGVRHSVGGQDYGSVRAAAFMGLKIASRLDQQDAAGSSGGHGPAEDVEPPPLGGGYLANLEPGLFRQRFEDRLPATLRGEEFLAVHGRHWDAATAVERGCDYPVRQATLHPVEENFRVEAFEAVLAAAGGGPRRAAVLGSLMYQSHASYSRCGLGSRATDRLVELTRREAELAAAEGRSPPLYGAKITGGGSGGTVCILGRDDAAGEAAIERLVTTYSGETGGFQPTVFRGSSAGAATYGALRLRLKPSARAASRASVDV